MGQVARYTSSRWYSSLALCALGCAVFAGALALRWPMAAIPAAVFMIPAIILGALAVQPSIEIEDDILRIGSREIPWREIRRLDQIQWRTHVPVNLHMPVAIYVTLEREDRMMLVHAGTPETNRNLLRQLRRHATRALLDGIPYRQYWGELNAERTLPVIAQPALLTPPAPVEPAKAHLLLPEDEAEVERLFQRLKTAGRLDTPSLPQ